MTIQNRLLKINDASLQFIAEKTKLYNTGIAESFPLWKRDLLFSINYDRIIICTSSDLQLKHIINTISLCKYLKDNFNKSQIILVTRKGCGLSNIYDLFSNYFDKHIKVKRLFELENIADKEKITKYIHAESLPIYEKMYGPFEQGLMINTVNLSQKTNNTDKIYYLISADRTYLYKVYPILSSSVVLNHCDPIDIKLKQAYTANYFVNIKSKTIIDHLVAFLDINIYHDNNSIYDSPLIKSSICFKNHKIHSLKQLSILNDGII